MRFNKHDNLRICTIVARHGSFSAAGHELHLTKGAVSYQVKSLESQLGFAVFQRLPRGIGLTAKGKELLQTALVAFEEVERKIEQLRESDIRTVTVGTSTYFASRWLSSRLMEFMRMYPEVRLRIQPMVDLLDLAGEGIDLAVRWGDGKWKDLALERLFQCPAFPVGAPETERLIRKNGMDAAFRQLVLLRDTAHSNAWPDWFKAADLRLHETVDWLIIPDPNVRVQAVIDGQGVALNDKLVSSELRTGQLVRLSDAELEDYGYFLAYPPGAFANPDVEAFARWLLEAAAAEAAV